MQYPPEILIYQRYETIIVNNKRYFHSASTNFYSLHYIYSFIHISALRESQNGPTSSNNLRLFSLFSSPNNVAYATHLNIFVSFYHNCFRVVMPQWIYFQNYDEPSIMHSLLICVLLSSA
jgi:hypothetical protein